jgi:DNA-directed RNA polymerase specialized sigma24 family protein
MIFNNSLVTELVLRWQNTRDPKILDYIIKESTPLVEAIISSYDYSHREDLIQESLLRIQYAIQFFDPDISNLHNYLTTVIRNISASFLSKQSKEPEINIDDVSWGWIDDRQLDNEDILSDLIERNRQRFPSIPVNVIDEVTEHIYQELVQNSASRKVVADVSTVFNLPKPVATTIHQSTLIWLRSKYSSYAKLKPLKLNEELTTLPDLCDLIGKVAYERVMISLSGMTLRIP